MKKFIFAVALLCLLPCLCGCGNNTDKHTHKFIATVISPTCLEEGYTHYVCRNCGYYYKSDFVPADTVDGHSYVNCVCTICSDFLKDEAVDTESLLFTKSSDRNGIYYEVTGVSAVCPYIKIPSTYEGIPVKKISDKAFWNVLALKHIIIPDGIEAIGDQAFEHCFNLVGVYIPDSVISIGERAFMNCPIKSVSLASITEVSEAAFANCRHISSFEIPNGVTSIGVSSFENCISCTSVTIPSSVTYISHGAFANDENLKDIYYEGTKELWLAIVKEVGLYTNGSDASWDAYTGDYTVHCSDGDIPKNEANQRTA